MDSLSNASGRPVSVPTGVYLANEDTLRLTVFNSVAGVTITVTGRMLTPDARIVPYTFDFIPTTDRSAKSTIVNPGDGWLLSAGVYASAGAPRRGQCFCVLDVVQGLLGAVTMLGNVWQGYVTDTYRQGFPHSPSQHSIEGPGCIRSITGTNPAAGADISETVPTNARWRLITVRADLVTSAAVANRQPTLIIDDGANELARSQLTTNETASAVWRNTWADVGSGVSGVGVGVIHVMPAGLVLMGGYRIRTLTALIDPADDWGAPQLLVEEWIED